jgi:hypothetical protein
MGIFNEDGKLQTGWASKSDGLDMNEQRRLLAIELRKQDVKLCNPVQDLTEDIFERLESKYLRPPTDILVQAENGTYQAILLGDERDEGDQGKTFHIDYLCSTVKGGGVALINKVKERFSKIELEPVSKSLAVYYGSLNFNYKNIKESDTMVWISQKKGARRTRRKKLRKTRRKHKRYADIHSK